MVAMRQNKNYVVYDVYVQSSTSTSHCDSLKGLNMSV